jgi:integrase
MKLPKAVDEYVKLKIAIGFKFRSIAATLRSFYRAMGDVEVGTLDPADVSGFVSGNGPITSSWHHRFDALVGLNRYLMSRDCPTLIPLPSVVPKRPQPRSPYIYRPEELRRLLALTVTFNRVRAGRMLLGSTLRVLVLLFYGTGLRLGEALSLNIADADLAAGVLTIRDTKFFKTRLVPIGDRLGEELKAYLRWRLALPCPDGEASPFFVTRRGKRLDCRCVQENFRAVCILAGVRRDGDARQQPRIHDLRHTFAVHRLVAWYREGADVQRLLPKLSTYLGHIDVAATQRYLTMTPELLSEANRRFERYAFEEARHAR